MTTVLLSLGAVALVLVLVAVMHQMFSSPLLWLMHAVNGTVGLVLEGIVWCVAGVFEAITGSNG